MNKKETINQRCEKCMHTCAPTHTHTTKPLSTWKLKKKQLLTSKLSSSFIPACHFSNSLSQLRTVFRGQTTSAVEKLSFSQSSKVWRNVTTYRANAELQWNIVNWDTTQVCRQIHLSGLNRLQVAVYILNSHNSHRHYGRFVTPK